MKHSPPTNNYTGFLRVLLNEKEKVGKVYGFMKFNKGKLSCIYYMSEELGNIELEGEKVRDATTTDIGLLCVKPSFLYSDKECKLPKNATPRQIAREAMDGRLIGLLIKHPERAQDCAPYILALDLWDVYKVLAHQPDLYQFFDLEELIRESSEEDVLEFWEYLICTRPEFHKKIEWRNLGSEELSAIGACTPQVFPASVWGKLTEDDLEDVIADSPGLGWECPLQFHTPYTLSLFARKYPEGARRKFDEESWSRIPGRRWMDILEESPELGDLCDWGKVKKTMDSLYGAEEEDADYDVDRTTVFEILDAYPDKKYVFAQYLKQILRAPYTEEEDRVEILKYLP